MYIGMIPRPRSPRDMTMINTAQRTPQVAGLKSAEGRDPGAAMMMVGRQEDK